jgi:hypothetical protein
MPVTERFVLVLVVVLVLDDAVQWSNRAVDDRSLPSGERSIPT